MTQNKKRKAQPTSKNNLDDTSWSFGFKVAVFALALVAGKLNHYHVSSLFENDRHFSHLSNMEREMTFRTEMGMYYSYFKTLVRAQTLNEGLIKLYRNNMTEYPDTINTLKRFNLYPELLVGVLYRGLNNFGLLSETCWTVNRGQGLDPVQSCEGLKDPPHFYLAVVWLCAGLTVSLIFILGVYLSDSILGGVLSSACFFFNHGEATRVMWTPPLRESFAFPICLLQILAVTATLPNTRPGWKNILWIASSTSAFILSWQFAQFMLFTQISAVLGLYVLGTIHKDTISSISISLLIGLLHAVALMFGNEMLFCSWLFSALCSCLLLVLPLDPLFNKLNTVLRVLTQGVLYLVFTIGLKMGLSKALMVQDDAHVFQILKSKFTDFKNFDTQLYTCAAEFNFLGWEMPWKITLTLLLPSALLAVSLVAGQLIRKALGGQAELVKKAIGEENSQEHDEERLDPGTIYTVLQTAAYAVLAVLIMRLKLFLTPHLCILTSLLASPMVGRLFRSKEVHRGVLVALLAAMAFQGTANITEQRKIMGEYSDPQLEEMFEWIIKNTAHHAVFAGPMPTMANLLLSTERNIVNHPHYEDVGSRERTKKVYSVYSRREAQDVFDILKDMKVDYLVLSRPWCLTVERAGCAMPDLWDLEEQENKTRPALCPILWKSARPFVKVFSNQEYQILQVSPRTIQLKQTNAKQR